MLLDVSILAPGSKAPNFTLSSHRGGEPVRLADRLALGNTLLVFYPGDFAPT
jgi:peroxiredoxin